jgi:cell division protein ZapE
MFDSQNIIDELKNQGIEPDSSQIELIRKLCRIRFNKNNFLNLKFFKNTSCSGIYIWGEVGRGKTLITNAFLKKCTSIKFKSFHYIDLMKFIHSKLTEYAGKKDPLKLIKKDLSTECQLIFIDEFQVEDVADAMIVGNLVNALVDDGLKIILTSNAHPDDLYKDGLQRRKFLNAIEMLKKKIEVFKLVGEIDYRSKQIFAENVFGKNYSDKEISQLISVNTEAKNFIDNNLLINDRKFNCKQVQNNLLWIEYIDFFRQPTAADDFLMICEKYDWIFISGFSSCDDESLDIVRRFISFVDIAYKEKTKVKFFFNKCKINEIYIGTKMGVIWDRCESRLNEMHNFSHINNS